MPAWGIPPHGRVDVTPQLLGELGVRVLLGVAMMIVEPLDVAAGQRQAPVRDADPLLQGADLRVQLVDAFPLRGQHMSGEADKPADDGHKDNPGSADKGHWDVDRHPVDGDHLGIATWQMMVLTPVVVRLSAVMTPPMICRSKIVPAVRLRTTP